MGLTSLVHALWLPTGQWELVKKSGREEDRISIPCSLLIWGCDFWPWPCLSEARDPGGQYHSISPALEELQYPRVFPALSGLLETASTTQLVSGAHHPLLLLFHH